MSRILASLSLLMFGLGMVNCLKMSSDYDDSPFGDPDTLKASLEDDDCLCLNWKSVYLKRAARCGETLEFFLVSGKKHLEGAELKSARATYGVDICKDFYQVINNNTCVNVNVGADQGAWCFVHSSCTKLNGGEKSNNLVAWKMCEEGQDKMLRDYSPEELYILSDTNRPRLALPMLHKFAYPVVQGVLFKQVSGFWGLTNTTVNSTIPENMKEYFPDVKGDGSFRNSTAEWMGFVGEEMGDGSITPGLSQVMQAIKDSGKPHTFDTNTKGHAPLVTVEGDKVYFVATDRHACIHGC